MKTNVEKKRNILLGFLACLAFGIIFGMTIGIGISQRPASTKDDIYPSIFMTGSDGDISTIDPMVQGIVSSKGTVARRGLQFVYQKDGSLKISGMIDKKNRYPTVEIGMVEGTNNSSKVEAAIVAVLHYLQSHYNVQYYNMLGFSAGGSGVFRYLIDHSTDHSLPTVKKWVSLDGQYNASTAQPNQTLDDVLQNGPEIQTKYYQNFVSSFQKFDSQVQVAMLAGKDPGHGESDGVVPWADTFSIYHLLIENGNPVSRYICTGDNTWHGDMPKNKQAIAFVENFFYN